MSDHDRAAGWAGYPCIFCGEGVGERAGPDDPTRLTVRFRDGSDGFEEWSMAVHGACFREATPHLTALAKRSTLLNAE